MKRRWFLPVIVILCLSMLTGCGGVQVTDEQNRMIAEYAAELLLKYDRNYQEHLVDTSETEEASSEVMTEEEKTEEGTTKASTEDKESTTTEEDTEEDSETAEEPDSTEEGVTTEEDTSKEGEDLPPADIGSITDIAEIAGLDGVSITYNRVMFLDRYPSIDQDGAFIYLESDPGYKLAVIKFDIVNTGDSNVDVDLLNREVIYKLTLNGSKNAKPMLTILMDDLGTYQGTVAVDATQDAVLVFQISEDLVVSIDSLSLQVSYEGKSGIIRIQ